MDLISSSNNTFCISNFTLHTGCSYITVTALLKPFLCVVLFVVLFWEMTILNDRWDDQGSDFNRLLFGAKLGTPTIFQPSLNPLSFLSFFSIPLLAWFGLIFLSNLYWTQVVINVTNNNRSLIPATPDIHSGWNKEIAEKGVLNKFLRIVFRDIAVYLVNTPDIHLGWNIEIAEKLF